MFGGKIDIYSSSVSGSANAFNSKSKELSTFYTIPESTYTRAEIYTALNNKIFYDENTGLNTTTTSLMGTYIPDWDKCYYFYGNSNSISSYDDLVNLFNTVDITNLAPNNTFIIFYNSSNEYGGAHSIVNNTDTATCFINNSTTITNGTNSYSSQFYIPIIVCRYVSLTQSYFYFSLPIKCSDGYTYITIYSNNSYKISVGTLQTNYFDFFDEFESDYTPDTDPYSEGGSSGGGGGTGDFDNTSDIIPIPSLPSVSGLNTGFFTAFVCSASDMRNVCDYLWNDLITDMVDPESTMSTRVDALKKVVANPYDAIMGCSLVPVSPSIGGSKDLKMYGILNTGVSLSYASSRWVEVDCGTLNINEFWGAYLDYAPYTKTTSLYLPYIGVVSIDIDLIMGKSLQVVYHVDILSGICIAYIVVNGSVEFQYQGHCATSIPVTSADFSSTIQSALGIVGSVANITSSAVGGGVAGGPAGAIAGASMSAISQAPSIASNVMGMKPDIKSGGSVGSSGGILGVQKPFLIIERPNQSIPSEQNTFTGYPSNMTKNISECTGYTEYETINLDNVPLTAQEKDELEQILKGGVYL